MHKTVALQDIIAWCDAASGTPGFPDYDGACNGLQFENSGRVSKIGAAVDANLPTFGLAQQHHCDLLIAHHGMLWNRPRSYTGILRRKFGLLIEANIAVYSSHLPLDAHPVLGNNVSIARRLHLKPSGTFSPHEGRDIGVLAEGLSRQDLRDRLASLFPAGIKGIEAGSAHPSRIAICSGCGEGAFEDFIATGADTFITGELPQRYFTEAMERRVNLYVCGHYATETFGVCELAEAAAREFGLPWEFLDTACPL
jgi:dinuclear metal center YbgI/SA1388 family protein